MDCPIEKIVKSGIDNQFARTFYFCRLLEKKGIGMNGLGVISAHSCIKVQMLGDRLSDLMMRGIINWEDLERNPNAIIENLEEELKKYAVAINKVSGKDIMTVITTCRRCSPIEARPKEAPKAPASKMSNVARRDS
jgi:hypothetical protein